MLGGLFTLRGPPTTGTHFERSITPLPGTKHRELTRTIDVTGFAGSGIPLLPIYQSPMCTNHYPHPINIVFNAKLHEIVG